MIQATLPAADVAAHGAGYPLTYRFTVPDQPGLVGQWSADGQAWHNLPAPPTYRADGIDMCRIAGTTAWLSCAFPSDATSLYLRVWSGAADVGTYTGICEYYDDRAAPVIFTYDDSTSTSIRASEVHRANRLWMSPGINSGRLNESTITASQLDQIVQAGYAEPINHGANHLRAQSATSYEQARADIVDGKDDILAACTMPPQSRGRVHAYIYPGGEYSAWAYQACAEAGHLTARITNSESVAAADGRYIPGEIDTTYGLVLRQLPTIAMALAPISGASAIAAGQKMIDAVNTARARRGMCLLYSYTYNWDLADGQPWQQAIATIGAMTDIWSVGYGHYALYRHTAARVAVRSLPGPRSVEVQTVHTSGTVAVAVPPGIPGDLLIAVYRYTSAGRAAALPGWTLVADSSQSSGGVQTAVWWRRADGTESSLTLSPTQLASTGWGCVGRWRNVRRFQSAISGWELTRRTSAGTQEIAPAVAGGDGLLVRIYSPTGGGNILPPAGARVVAQSPGILITEQAGPASAAAADLSASSTSGQAWTLVLDRVPGVTPGVQSIGGIAVLI